MRTRARGDRFGGQFGAWIRINNVSPLNAAWCCSMGDPEKVLVGDQLIFYPESPATELKTWGVCRCVAVVIQAWKGSTSKMALPAVPAAWVDNCTLVRV